MNRTPLRANLGQMKEPYLKPYTITNPRNSELRLATQIVRKYRNGNDTAADVLMSHSTAVSLGLEPDPRDYVAHSADSQSE